MTKNIIIYKCFINIHTVGFSMFQWDVGYKVKTGKEPPVIQSKYSRPKLPKKLQRIRESLYRQWQRH
jgi:hypothetical protein